MSKIFIACAIIIIQMSACQGVRFGQMPTNLEMPKTFVQRALYPAGVAGYNFKDLVGTLLLTEGDTNTIQIGVIRPAGYIPEVEIINDPNNYYNSKIEKGAEVQGSYLSFAADLKAEELREITIFDVAYAGIKLGDGNNYAQIEDSLRNWVGLHPRPPGKNRLWIKAAVLTKKIINSYVKIETNASGQIEVVGVKSGVYALHKSESREVLIAFEAIDIDELVGATRLLPVEEPLVLEKFGYFRPILKPIIHPH